MIAPPGRVVNALERISRNGLPAVRTRRFRSGEGGVRGWGAGDAAAEVAGGPGTLPNEVWAEDSLRVPVGIRLAETIRQPGDDESADLHDQVAGEWLEHPWLVAVAAPHHAGRMLTDARHHSLQGCFHEPVDANEIDFAHELRCYRR